MKSWKTSKLSTIILKNDKIDVENTHNATMQNIHGLTLVLYIDEVKSIRIKKTKSAVFLTTNSKIFSWTKHHTMHNKMQFDENNKIIGINWKLNPEITELDPELHAIHKATIWMLKLVNAKTFAKTIYLFTDSQMALKSILNLNKNGYAKDIRKNIKSLLKQNYLINYHWIPAHTNIMKNHLTNNLTKQTLNDDKLKIQKLSITFDYLKNQIKKNVKQLWKNQWNKFKKKTITSNSILHLMIQW